MNLQDYFQQQGAALSFSREQASNFAKQIAGDFNPIHDTDARRFCVPGDLLFAVLLQQQGLFHHMQIEFAGMVTEKSEVLTEQTPGQIKFVSDSGSDFIVARHDQQSCGDAKFIENLTRAYVTFSGQTFPHILVPLMKENNAMINPARPIVMYREMSLTLDTCSGEDISLFYKGAEFKADGKKGEASLFFDIKAGNETIGSGMKNMLLSGLRPFDQEAVDGIVAEYDSWKTQANNN